MNTNFNDNMNEPSNAEKIAAVAGAAPCSAKLIDKLISRAEQACRYAVKHQNLGDSDYDLGFAVGGDVCEKAIREHIMRHLAEDVRAACLPNKDSAVELAGSGPLCVASAWLGAGTVAPSMKRYRIIWPHGHKTLRVGDVVVMTESPSCDNMLLREPDMTLHRLQDDDGQYVHMVDASNRSA